MRCKYCKSEAEKHGFYKRFVKDGKGDREIREIQRYRCLNCERTFSILHKDLLPRHQYTKDYYAGILHARHNNHNTLRKTSIPGFIKVAKSTLHAVCKRFAGLIESFKPSRKPKPRTIFIDDKYVKPNNTAIFARDEKGRILHTDAFPSRWPNEEHVIEFLEGLRTKISVRKNLVFMTDMWTSYAPAICKVFPNARHAYCLLHIYRAINRAVKQTPKSYGNLTELKTKLYDVFDTRSGKGASRRLNKILRYQKWRYQGTKISGLLKRMSRERDKLFLCLNKDMPKTNNMSEQGIALLTPLIKVAKLMPNIDRLKETLKYFEFSRTYKNFSLLF